MSEEDLAVGQHRTVGKLLLTFGGVAFTVAAVAHFQGIDTGFLTPTDTLMITLIMMIVGDTLRRWEPE